LIAQDFIAAGIAVWFAAVVLAALVVVIQRFVALVHPR
jgi:hypothetical protein